MSYLVTARKWRPKDFTSVVGQVHVTQSLKNAIERDRVGQSYLFSGPRGVGKTTLARILVKALNCVKGPTTHPCNACSFCEEVNQNSALDYVEIDGASNRGIDQVRDINDSLKYISPNNKHRVFVIDEVHMLTTEAFNALLKSLEEPPPKIIFIFCTTEAHKVPATIRSRCQHFRFRAFPLPDITQQLESILKSENIPYEINALFHIAKASEGSMRDSQSILDQVLAYADTNITEAAVLEVLGIDPHDVYLNFLQNLAKEDVQANLKVMHDLLKDGRGVKPFIYSLIERVHVLQFIHAGVDDPHILGVVMDEYQRLVEMSSSYKLSELQLINDMLFEFIRELRVSTEEVTAVHLFLLKLHRFKTMITAEQLRMEIDKLLTVSHKKDEAEEPAHIASQPMPSLPPKESPGKPEPQSGLKFKPIERKKVELTEEMFFEIFEKEFNQDQPIKTWLKYIGFDQPALTLQIMKSVEPEEIKSMTQKMIKLIHKKINAKVKVNILSSDLKSTQEIHNVLKTFDGEIVPE